MTLEGVPSAFLNRTPLLVDILHEELPARHFRLSMGIQTFAHDRLAMMGRLGFGSAETFRKVVELGHARGFTVSGDLLFNLPSQSLAEMQYDVRQATEMGLDHLGLYHLVMFAGLGTQWSQDPAILNSLPANDEAAGNWLELRKLLDQLGFDQTTLTNFERRQFRGADRRFVYEELSFRPDRYDTIGFGPTGISLAARRQEAVKVINPDRASDYIAAVRRGRPAWDRAFVYGPRDLRVLHLVRRLAGLRIERRDYETYFGTDPIDDFPREFAVVEHERLVRVTDQSIEPTPLGMFYADSIARLLSWRRIIARRNGRNPDPTSGNDNGDGHM